MRCSLSRLPPHMSVKSDRFLPLSLSSSPIPMSPTSSEFSPKTSTELEKGDLTRVNTSEPQPENKPIHVSPTGWRRLAIISFVCSAQFFDIFNACASIAALPSVRSFRLHTLATPVTVRHHRLVKPSISRRGCFNGFSRHTP